MNPGPLLAAPAVIQVHAAAAVAALVLGAVQLWLPKGTARHRRLGWAWSVLIVTVAASSFWISRERFAFGPFSWIHGLSLFALVMLPLGLWAAHRGRVRRHHATMISIFVGALVIAGLFTLSPGRIIGRAVFGG